MRSAPRESDLSGTAVFQYGHDAFGNRVFQGTFYSGTASLIYDESNRLVEVRDPANGFATVASYAYDAFGRRVKKTTPTRTVLYMYDPDGRLLQEIEKKPAATDEVRVYVYLEDELVGLVDSFIEVGTAQLWPIRGWRWRSFEGPGWLLLAFAGSAGLLLVAARRHPTPATVASSAMLVVFTCAGTNRPPAEHSWVHTDPLGTPLAVTGTPFDPEEVVAIWRARHEPFGKATVDEDPDGNEVLFSLDVRLPGQLEDAETGWHYNFYRTYDPSTGRYLEPDPIGVHGGSNLYAYAYDDPINAIDPTGLIFVGRFGGPISLRRPYEYVEDAVGAAKDFYDNNSAMKRAFRETPPLRQVPWGEPRRADRYFHCLANCQAAQRGEGGEDASCVLSDLREWGSEDLLDSEGDQEANRFGRQAGAANPEVPCWILCEKYRPLNLPTQFW